MTRRMALRQAAKNKARKTEAEVKAMMLKLNRFRMDIYLDAANRIYRYSDGHPVYPDEPRMRRHTQASKALGRS